MTENQKSSNLKISEQALKAARAFDEQLIGAGLPDDFLSRRIRTNANAEIIQREAVQPAVAELITALHAAAIGLQDKAANIGTREGKANALAIVMAALAKYKATK